MSIHFENLRKHIKNFDSMKMLDIGSGRGKFLIYAAKNNINAIGLERNQNYIDLAFVKAKKESVKINVIQGQAENLPFEDGSFDFINLSELIEHVDEPNKLLSETYRVMRLDSYAYISIPSRFGIKDSHFHLYFVNWLPRKWCNFFIGLFKKHKDYTNKAAGRQNLAEMHYYRLKDIKNILYNVGFEVLDIRELKINKFKNIIIKFLAIVLYKLIKSFYFDTFHLLLIKKDEKSR